MSLKNMAVKLALAFAAAKGVQAFRDAGGMEGVKRKMAEQKRAGGSQGGLGGLLGAAGGGAQGSLGGMLGGLLGGGAAGMAATGQPNENREPAGRAGRQGFDGLLGGLAGVTGSAGSEERMKGLLESTQDEPDVDDEQIGGLMIRAMVQSAKADGEIDAGERAAILDVLDESNQTDIEFVQRQMDSSVDPEALAADTPKGLEREVYTASVVAIEPDNRAEAQFLDRLAKALHLDQETVNAIHEAHGKTPLYST